MASPSSNPFYGSNAGTTPANSNYLRLALDNLIRRELKVGDPGDPRQIAEALLSRYQDDPRAKAIGQEARGLPFLLSSAVAAPAAPAASSSANELKQALDDVDCDLRELTTHPLLKDVTPEIQGWAQAIRSAIAEGSTAARFALDPRQRDKVFGIRRSLGDYARAARLVGALTPTLGPTYRSFAKSLDEAAAVLLVMMGEALAEAGFNSGRYLLTVPYTELQVRRDTVINALRNLVGSTQYAYGQNEWPYGLHAYQRLFDVLEEQGQGDLRALLVESELSRMLDELIQRAAHGQPEGLRALGSTAEIDLTKFRRLIRLGSDAVQPKSPPLTAFLKGLQLFVDAFTTGGGYRLLGIARPPALLYGLYNAGFDSSEHILQLLILYRGQLATKLDCFRNCQCEDDNDLKRQIVLDKILYDLDRAIDLYAMGSDKSDAPETRALAYAFIISAFVDRLPKIPDAGTATLSTLENPVPEAPTAFGLNVLLESIQTALLRGIAVEAIDFPDDEAAVQKQKLRQPCAAAVVSPSGIPIEGFLKIPQAGVDIPALQGLCDAELCAQLRTEEEWFATFSTLAPHCSTLLTSGGALYGAQGLITQLIRQARYKLHAAETQEACPPPDISIPGTQEESAEKRTVLGLISNQLQAAKLRVDPNINTDQDMTRKNEALSLADQVFKPKTSGEIHWEYLNRAFVDKIVAMQIAPTRVTFVVDPARIATDNKVK